MAQPAKVYETFPLAPGESLEFIKRARSGDTSTLPALQKLFNDCPDAIERFGYDLARNIERRYIEALAGTDLFAVQAMIRKLELLRAELCGANPTPIERLLVERVVARWLQVQEADSRAARTGGPFTERVQESNQRRQNQAHRRYLSSLKTLALVRKLALPVLQVNIADQQINLASPATLPPGA